MTTESITQKWHEFVWHVASKGGMSFFVVGVARTPSFVTRNVRKAAGLVTKGIKMNAR